MQKKRMSLYALLTEDLGSMARLSLETTTSMASEQSPDFVFILPFCVSCIPIARD